MYRDLSCQHHLVQERYDERPDIPGLTPVGFERWVTLLIQAHPEEEFERLQKAVLEMPISNPDDKKERFPKEISRRLFPGHGDTTIPTGLKTLSQSTQLSIFLDAQAETSPETIKTLHPKNPPLPWTTPLPRRTIAQASASTYLQPPPTQNPLTSPPTSNANENLTPIYPLSAPSMT